LNFAPLQGFFYLTFLAGGLSRSDPLAARDNKEGKVMVFFRDVAAPFLNNSVAKAFIIFIFLVYLGVVIWGVLGLQEGLERKKLGMGNTVLKLAIATGC
jgi:hypothetical protein